MKYRRNCSWRSVPSSWQKKDLGACWCSRQVQSRTSWCKSTSTTSCSRTAFLWCRLGLQVHQLVKQHQHGVVLTPLIINW